MSWTAPKTWAAGPLTSGDLNTHVRDNLLFLKTNIALASAVELTIAAGVVTKSQAFHKIDTQGDASSDDLDTISGGAEGEVLYLRAENAARTVIVKNGTGNITLEHDVVMDDADKILILIHDGATWNQIAAPTFEAFSELTISAGGAITITGTHHTVDTSGDAASDNLDTITGGVEGMIIFLKAENAARTVICRHGIDNLDLRGNDIYLTDVDQALVLIYNGSNWLIISPPNLVQEFMANAFQYPNPGTDWTPALKGAGLGANLTAKKCWLPLNFLKLGDQILSYKLVGDAVEAAAITLDCKFVSINKADPITTTDIAGGGITQIDADGDFDSEAVLTAAEVIATDKQYVLEILGTTGAADAITVMGAEVNVIRL